jgi:hypothetical protein
MPEEAAHMNNEGRITAGDTDVLLAGFAVKNEE